MALHPCKECGQEVSSAAKLCPHCGKPLAGKPLDTKAGCAVLLGVLVLVAIISTVVDMSFRGGSKNTVHTGAPSSTAGGPSLEARREKAREDSVLGLQRFYDEQGLDVGVSEGANGELVLTSDLFKAVGPRDRAIGSLLRNTRAIGTMCALGFSELDVSYSKGLLSGDVTRRVPLPCREDRGTLQPHPTQPVGGSQAGTDALQPERDQFALSLQADFARKPGLDVRAVARGTTLMLTSDHLFNTREARRTFLAMFIQDTETVSKLCGIGFRLVRAAGPRGVGRGVALPCEP